MLRKAYVVAVFWLFYLLGSRILVTSRGNFQHLGKSDFISLLLCPVPAVKGWKKITLIVRNIRFWLGFILLLHWNEASCRCLSQLPSECCKMNFTANFMVKWLCVGTPITLLGHSAQFAAHKVPLTPLKPHTKGSFQAIRRKALIETVL